MKASFDNYGTCKYCGKRIIWRKTAAGKNMPCEPDPICYKVPERGKGSKTILTKDGENITADRVVSSVADGIGYIPHFITCKRK